MVAPLLPHQNGFHQLTLEDSDLSNKSNQTTTNPAVVDDVDDEGAHTSAMIPGLPRFLAYKCLAHVPRESHFSASQVSKAWRGAFVSGKVYRIRRQMGISEPWIYLAFCPNAKVLRRYRDNFVTSPSKNMKQPYMTWLEAYDPLLNVWHNLGPVPGIPENYSLKDFGFVALGDKLYLLGGRLTPNPLTINHEGASCSTDHQHQNNSSSRLGSSNGSNDSYGSCHSNSSSDVISSSSSDGGSISSSNNQSKQNYNNSSNQTNCNNENLMQIHEVIRKEVLVFNCTTRQWSECASMSTARVNFACTVCKGRIYVAGGRTQPGQEKGVSSAEVYIPETDCWMALPGMSTGRYKCVGVTIEEKIHIVGGFAGPEESDQAIDPFNINRSCADVFHPLSGQWTLLKGMWQLDIPPNQIVTVEGRLYSSGDALNTWKGRIEEYDIATNMWKIVDGSWLPMTHPEECHISERCYLTMAPIGHCLYFLGGYRLPSDSATFSLHTIYIFDTTAKDAASQWQLVEPLQDTCKELCTHCRDVTL